MPTPAAQRTGSRSMPQAMKCLGAEASTTALAWLAAPEAADRTRAGSPAEFELLLAQQVLASLDWSSYVAEAVSDWPRQRPLPGDAKSAARLAEARLAGIEALDCGLLRLAALRFSECARHAQPGSVDLAVAFANRSLAFKRLGLYAESVADAEAALSLPYGDDRVGKLFARIAECQKLISAKSTDSTLSSPPGQEWKPNPHLPHASNKVDLAVADDNRGRSLVALEDIDVGELVIFEPAFSAVLNSGLRETHCATCLTPCHRLLPCHGCSAVAFCSEACRDLVDGVHAAECGWLASWLDSAFNAGIGRLAFATVLFAGGPRAVVDAVNKRLTECAKPGVDAVFGAVGDYQSVLDLVAGETRRGPEDLARRVGVAYQMALLLSPQFESIASPEFAARLAAALLHHLMLIPCNAHDVTALTAPPSRLTSPSLTDSASSVEVSALTIRDIGSAVYPTASLINHSCDPNLVRVTGAGLRLEIRALRPIAKGSELLDNYGWHWAVHSRQQRLENLRSQYLFDCDCQACQGEWPLYEGLLSIEPNWVVEGEAKVDDTVVQDEAEDSNTSEVVAKVEVDSTIKAEVESAVAVVVEFVSSSSASAGQLGADLNARFAPRLLSLIGLLQRRVRRPHRWFNDAEECIKMVWSAQGRLDAVGTD